MKITLCALFGLLCLILPVQVPAQSGIIIYDGTSGIVGTLMRYDTANILSIVPESPAHKAGLQYNDQIIRINDHQVSGNGTTNLQLKELLAGSAEDSVSLVIKRGSPDSLFSLTLQNDLHLHELNYYQFVYLVDSMEVWDIRDVLSD